MSLLSRSAHSREFFDLVKAIGESKSKQEEDQIIVNEIQTLKKRLAEKGNSTAKMKEFLVRLIYIEMLGHDATFAYVYAIQLTASRNLLQKRVGYLCSALCLSPDHEFRFMLVNQIQRDLKSDNMLEVSTALTAVCKLVTEEMIPAVLPIVAEKLKHEQPSVRKKAAMALHRCYQLSSESVSHLETSFRNVLYDKDPSVMGASLCWLFELAKRNPASHKDLVPSYVSVLKQITEHRLDKNYDYHRIPAPWMQIKLLKLLAILGKNDRQVSEEMYEALMDCMRRADTGSNVGCAIIYECVKTVTAIYPNTKLLDSAAAAISRFITSDAHNLKYLGVTGLAAIVRDHPRYATKHQVVVLDCLEDPDETLRRQTLDLLYRMTNPVNAEVIVEKLLEFLRQGADVFLRRGLVEKITQLAERYAPSNQWYVRTMATLFEIGGDLVEPQVMNNLLRLIGEGSDDEAGDREMRLEACGVFMDLLEGSEPSALPEVLLNVIFWTLGEYSFLLGEHQMPQIIEDICAAASGEISSTARGYAISAVFKMSAQLGVLAPCTAQLVDTYASSVSADIQQRCYEVQSLAQDPSLMGLVLPVDACAEDFSNVTFDFLRPFVDKQIAEGMPGYSPPGDAGEDDDDDEEFNKKIETLRFEAYEKPQLPSSSSLEAQVLSGTDSSFQGETEVERPAGPVGLNLKGVKPVWGSAGYGSKTATGAAGTQQASAETNGQPSADPEEASLAAQLGFELPPGITLKDIQDDLRAREQLERGENSEQASAAVTGTQPESPPAASKPTIPPKPKELTERERMAAALFGGVSSEAPASRDKPSTTKRPRRRIGREDSNSNAVSEPAQVEVDLLGLADSAATPSPESFPVASHGEDLLDLLSPAAAPEGGQEPAPQNTDQSDLVGLLGSVDLGGAPVSGLVPNSIDTPTFGSLWGSHDQEHRLSISTPQANVEALAEDLASKANVCAVEVIPDTQEAIFSGLSGGTQVVLVHAKLRGDGFADLMVRSQDAALTSQVATFLSS